MSEGFLLAATVASDRNARQGRDRLSATAAAAFDAWAQAIVGTTAAERRVQIKRISRQVAAPMTGAQHSLPLRALALLSPLAARSIGEQWLREAPSPRPGFQAEPGLRRVLRTIAERGRWHG